jgi:hypothetical protein
MSIARRVYAASERDSSQSPGQSNQIFALITWPLPNFRQVGFSNPGVGEMRRGATLLDQVLGAFLPHRTSRNKECAQVGKISQSSFRF